LDWVRKKWTHVQLFVTHCTSYAEITSIDWLMWMLVDGQDGQAQVDIDIYGEAPDKMTYTEQANKRTHCKRLTW